MRRILIYLVWYVLLFLVTLSLLSWLHRENPIADLFLPAAALFVLSRLGRKTFQEDTPDMALSGGALAVGLLASIWFICSITGPERDFIPTSMIDGRGVLVRTLYGDRVNSEYNVMASAIALC